MCVCSEHSYNHKHVHYMLHRACIRIILPTQQCHPRGAADAGALCLVTPCTAVKGAEATRVPLLADSFETDPFSCFLLSKVLRQADDLSCSTRLQSKCSQLLCCGTGSTSKLKPTCRNFSIGRSQEITRVCRCWGMEQRRWWCCGREARGDPCRGSWCPGGVLRPWCPCGQHRHGGEGAAGPAGVLLPPAVVGLEPCNRRS